MAATKNTMTVDDDKKIRSAIVSMASNGSNLKQWERDVNYVLQMFDKSCLAYEYFNMHVDASKTISLGIKSQVARAVKDRRTEVVAEARFKKASEGTKMEPKDSDFEQMPPLESVNEDETKEKVKTKVEVTRVSDEDRMNARAELLAARITASPLLSERRGMQHTVFFLNPLDCFRVDEEQDKARACHVHTIRGETMRYALESSGDAQLRMKLDGMIMKSTQAVPAHITSGVVPGDIHSRMGRIVTHYDDIGRKALVEQVDNDFESIVFRKKESFATFTSRWQDIEYRMEQYDMKIDPTLLLGKLEKAIARNVEPDSVVIVILRQVKMTQSINGAPVETTSALFEAMAAPMRDHEKDAKATTEKVNAVQVGRGSGGKGGSRKGKGGKGGKGGRGGGKGGKGSSGRVKKGQCLRFAEGACDFGDDCYFNHVEMDDAEIAELRAKLAAAKAAGGGYTRSGGHTSSQVVNALQAMNTATKKATLADKMIKLRGEGLSDEQIVMVANMLLEKGQ